MLSVLIADDEPHVVELVRVTLEDGRVRVFEAADGETALAVVEALAIDSSCSTSTCPMSAASRCARALRANPRLSSARIVMLTAARSATTSCAVWPPVPTTISPSRFPRCGSCPLVDRLLPRVAWHLE